MKDIIYYFDDSYQGEGISLGIARGILVKYKNINIVQEWMGLGNLALKNGLMTYFSTTCKSVQLSETQFSKTFLIDGVMLWRINGKLSIFITRVIEMLAKCYMLLPGLQTKLLKTGTFFPNLVKITPQIIKITPISEACFNYSVKDEQLNIKCEIKSLTGYFNKVIILNELGADYFQKGIKDGKIVPPPSGWEHITSSPDSTAFYNQDYDLSFCVKKIKGINSNDDWDFENENKFIFESQFDEVWLKNEIKMVSSEFENKKHILKLGKIF